MEYKFVSKLNNRIFLILFGFILLISSNLNADVRISEVVKEAFTTYTQIHINEGPLSIGRNAIEYLFLKGDWPDSGFHPPRFEQKYQPIPNDPISCVFEPLADPGGATEKFYCHWKDINKSIKVKYTKDKALNHEVYAEPAASRLAKAFGYPADKNYVVPYVICYGCPKEPWSFYKELKKSEINREDLLKRLDNSVPVIFENVIIEYKFQKKSNYKSVNAFKDGEASLKSHLDSQNDQLKYQQESVFPLISLLNNWDARAKNVRLVCLETSDKECNFNEPLYAFIHDWGASFGGLFKSDLNNYEKSIFGNLSDISHRKANLRRWIAVSVWRNDKKCKLNTGIPFPFYRSVKIEPESLKVFLSRLENVFYPNGEFDRELARSLFEGSRFDKISPNGDVSLWVKAFEYKIDQLRNSQCSSGTRS